MTATPDLPLPPPPEAEHAVPPVFLCLVASVAAAVWPADSPAVLETPSWCVFAFFARRLKFMCRRKMLLFIQSTDMNDFIYKYCPLLIQK
jgi:hypothetical protein